MISNAEGKLDMNFLANFLLNVVSLNPSEVPDFLLLVMQDPISFSLLLTHIFQFLIELLGSFNLSLLLHQVVLVELHHLLCLILMVLFSAEEVDIVTILQD